MTRPDSTSILIPFLVACLSIAIYSSMDVLMKGLSISIGAYNAVIWRTAAGTAITGLAYLALKPKWPSTALMKLHIIRSAFVAVMAITFFWGLARLPMAEAISLAFIAPLLATFMAAFFLGEKLDRRAVIASCIGFSGVIVIVTGKLGQSDYKLDALLAVGAIFSSALCYAINLILARKQAQVTAPLEIAFYQNLFVTLILGAAAPWLLVIPSLSFAPNIIAAAAMASVSIFLLSWAYARAETQILATTEYTGFLWAMLYGWIFFSEPVKWPTIAGAALIVSACLVITRRKAEAQPPEAIAP
jgi:drug/metabolite transporter (DMT)-like permease